MSLSAPALLTADHDISQFACEHDSLTQWLQKRALANNGRRGSRTFVVCEGTRVIGFYALAAGAIEHEIAPKTLARNMPRPIPVIVLGRLAVDARYRGLGIGAGMLQDAIFRALNAANDIAARALLCHAIDDAARAFYLAHGFVESPVDAFTMMLDLGKVAKLVE